jgi:hypothetical protein
MPEPKTKPTEASVVSFLNGVADEERRGMPGSWWRS